MHPGDLQVDIEKGTAILTDADGRAASYHRIDGPFEMKGQHAVYTSPEKVVLTSLLTEADSFPEELIIKHKSPQPTPQMPAGPAGQWASDFRYVRDKS